MFCRVDFVGDGVLDVPRNPGVNPLPDFGALAAHPVHCRGDLRVKPNMVYKLYHHMVYTFPFLGSSDKR